MPEADSVEHPAPRRTSRPRVAALKEIAAPVAANADILVAPDLESANMPTKQLEYMSDAEAAGLVPGARVTIALTRRAGDKFSRMA